jgi:AraC-like DNA-binding protein
VRGALEQNGRLATLSPVEFEPGYHELAPPAELRDTLACVWVRVAGEPASVRVLPDACCDLVWRAGEGASVAGPDTGAWLSQLPAGTVVVGARFLPGAGGSALGLPLSELRDLRVPLAELSPGLARELDAQLHPRAAFDAVAAAAVRLAGTRPPDASVRRAARMLADPQARLRTLADDLGLSERQLRRRFHAGVGYGPKTLQRVLRFRRFLSQATHTRDLARVAADAGYADQAHLTRDCARLSGLTPSQLVLESG